VKHVRGVRIAALIVSAGALLSACNAGARQVKTVIGPTIRTTTTSRPGNSRQPTTTVVRGYHTYVAGQTGLIDSPSQHAAMAITVGPPSRSTTRLSPTYGYSPRFGHYVTFRLTIHNTGKAPIVLQRLDFWVTTPGTHKTTTNDGNSPYSGSGSQLDNTELTAGEHVTNDLTFDVANPTGTLYYAPGGHKELAWTF
jgi:hypothetical protein